MRAVIALAMMFGWALPANADNHVGVVVTGDSPELALIAAHFMDWLTNHGRVVVATPLSPAAITEVADCFAIDHPDCGRRSVDGQVKASTVVFVRVTERHEQTHDIALIAYWFDKGHPAIVERGGCERCTNDSLRSTTDAIMTRLSGDGTRPTGVVDNSVEATPGDARGGSARSVVWRALPLAAIGAGTAVLITGGILIAIDQADDHRAPEQTYKTAPAGVVLSIAGAAVVAAGAYLWFRRPEALSSPIAAVTGDSAYVGWLGRF